MNETKKCVVSFAAAVVLVLVFSISAAAIDTPWLPLEPDGGETEATTEDTTENVTNSPEPDREQESVTASPTEAEQMGTTATEMSVEKTAPQKGCSANHTLGIALIASLASSTLLLRRRGEAGKHERRLHER